MSIRQINRQKRRQVVDDLMGNFICDYSLKENSMRFTFRFTMETRIFPLWESKSKDIIQMFWGYGDIKLTDKFVYELLEFNSVCND